MKRSHLNQVVWPSISALAMASLGCGADPDTKGPSDDVASIEQKLWGNAGLWSSHDITVCYSPSTVTNFASQIAPIQGWIEESYGRVTDLRFHGWDTCPSNP